MNTTHEWLYDHYADPLLRAGGSWEEMFLPLLQELPLDEEQCFDLADKLSILGLGWATAAFSVGLRLGLGLVGEGTMPQ